MLDRPLVLTASGFLLAVLLACFFIGSTALLVIVTAALILAAVALSFTKIPVKRAALVITLGLAAGFAAWTAHAHFTVNPALSHAYTAGDITATVTDYPTVYDAYSRVTARVDTIDGDKIRSFKAQFYLSGDLGTVKPGDGIRVRAVFSLPKSGGDFDYRLYLRAHGIYLLAHTSRTPETRTPERPPLWAYPKLLAGVCAEKVDELFDAPAAGYIKALILGSRRDLDAKLTAQFRTAGLSHVLAVSGMHISFMVGLILAVFRRRAGTWIAIPAVILYVFLTGASASAVRAGIMQILWLLSFVVNREADSLTSLFAACGLIVVVNPSIIADVGLWMSFLATLGIILCAGRMSAALMKPVKIKNKAFIRILRFFASSLATTLSALLFVTPVIMAVFHEISLVASASNILILWAVQYTFVFGVLAIAAAFIWSPLAAVLAFPAKLLISYQSAVITRIASIPYASVSSDSVFIALFIALAYGIVILCALSKNISRRYIAVCVSAALIITVALTFAESRIVSKIVVMNNGGAQSTAVISGRDCVVINCGSDNRAALNQISGILWSGNLYKIDLLVITDYRSSASGNAEGMLENFKIGAILLPPLSGDSREAEIMAAAQAYGVAVLHAEGVAVYEYGKIRLSVCVNSGGGFDSGRMIACAEIGERSALIYDSVSPENLQRMIGELGVSRADIIAAGAYYAAKEAPDIVGSLGARAYILSSYAGADTKTVWRLHELGIYPVELERYGHIVYNISGLSKITD